jgi:transposase-like protein
MGRNKGGTNRKYTYEEKLRICRLYFDEHISVGDLSISEEIPQGNLGRWIIQYRDQGEEGLRPKKQGKPSLGLRKVKGMSELELLKFENLKLKVEVERLKKGYTVKGVGSKKVYVTLDGKIIKS